MNSHLAEKMGGAETALVGKSKNKLRAFIRNKLMQSVPGWRHWHQRDHCELYS